MVLQEHPPHSDARFIEGFPGYAVDASGEVWTCIGKGKPPRYARPWRKLATRISQNYRIAGLCRNGVKKMKTVHRLVLEAFVGPQPDGLEGCHNDGNPLNNRLDNLRWDTHKANMEDAVRHGIPRGEQKANVKLNADTVRECRQRNANGESLASLARKFGVSDFTMRYAVQGRTWAHVA